MTSKLIRRTALATAGAAPTLLAAGPAQAQVPEGWSNPPDVGFLDVLLVVGAVPLGVALLIALAVYLPALRRGESVRAGSDGEDAWFGGPRQGTAQLEAGRPPAEATGGGSGHW